MAGRMYGVNDKVFDKIDNQDKAYVLGLLYADGCNYQNGRVKIDLIEDDIDVLEKLKIFFEYEGEIKHHKQGLKNIGGKIYDCKDSCRLQFTSKRISSNLNKYGCTSNKTYTLLFPNDEIISENLLRHFIRGYMDGDGGISYWIDNKNTGHKKFQINFCGTTDMIIKISNLLSEKFNCCPSNCDRYKERDNNNLQTSICGNLVVSRILDWLYKDANIYMQRKYNKYIELKEEVERVKNDNNLYGSAHKRRKIIRLSDLKVYDSLIDSARDNGYRGASTICTRCKSNNGFMYLDEYEKGDNKWH